MKMSSDGTDTSTNALPILFHCMPSCRAGARTVASTMTIVILANSDGCTWNTPRSIHRFTFSCAGIRGEMSSSSAANVPR